VKPGMSLDGLPTEARGRGQTKFAQRVLSGQKQPPAPTLFFGNLGFETTIESIRALLEAHRVKAKRNAAPSESTTNDDGANDPWIRKIRMGTFEDSGLCKGSVCLPSKNTIFQDPWLTPACAPRFAFVDFASTEHATAALIHPKNHRLDGRKLVVEYASADAVRRGGGRGHKPKRTSTEGPRESHARSKKRDSAMMGDDDTNGKSDTETTITSSKPQEERSTAAAGARRRSGASAKRKVVDYGKHRKSRPAPGAALALAKREQVAIVPSQGRRIKFDDD
jgi:hypothetical protein